MTRIPVAGTKGQAGRMRPPLGKMGSGRVFRAPLPLHVEHPGRRAVDMPQSTCMIDGCERPVCAHDLCRPHYTRRRRHGDPHRGGPLRPQGRTLPERTVAERLWSKVDKSAPGGCWRWTGATINGYGVLRVDDRNVYVTGLAYELLAGPIPKGLEPDHQCHNQDETCRGGKTCEHRRCVKVVADEHGPAHIEAVTHVVNNGRSRSLTAELARRTHCKRGHPFSPENTHRTPQGARRCRTCNRERQRKGWQG